MDHEAAVREEDLLFTLDNGVGRITFNRPQARNAFTFEMYERLAEPDVGLRDQNLHCRQLRDRFGRGSRFFFRATGEIGGDTAGTQGDDQNDDTCDIHTLYNSYAGTPQLHGNDSHPRRYD